MKNKVFGVIGAMESEVAQLRAALGNMETAEHSGLTFYRGTMGENRVVLVKCGIGKVNAARCRWHRRGPRRGGRGGGHRAGAARL